MITFPLAVNKRNPLLSSSSIYHSARFNHATELECTNLCNCQDFNQGFIANVPGVDLEYLSAVQGGEHHFHQYHVGGGRGGDRGGIGSPQVCRQLGLEQEGIIGEFFLWWEGELTKRRGGVRSIPAIAQEEGARGEERRFKFKRAQSTLVISAYISFIYIFGSYCIAGTLL